jgi:single-strand DNA-binding protein
MINVVAIMGRLVADPELRTTPAGVNVCQFRIACDRNFARQGEQRQADFVDIVAWRAQADFVCKYFSKGSLIAINGRIQTRNYQDKNGNNRTAFAVVAENINFGGSKGTSSAKVDDGGEAAPRSEAWPKADPPANYGGVDDFAVIDDNDDLPF